ncbi:hypothetical protein FB451DRAFT_299346 [Mycena latifolia]|nr:hypothetical protein FB451DRAFT_299346 [Mycena latifolia]
MKPKEALGAILVVSNKRPPQRSPETPSLSLRWMYSFHTYSALICLQCPGRASQVHRRLRSDDDDLAGFRGGVEAVLQGRRAVGADRQAPAENDTSQLKHKTNWSQEIGPAHQRLDGQVRPGYQTPDAARRSCFLVAPPQNQCSSRARASEKHQSDAVEPAEATPYVSLHAYIHLTPLPVSARRQQCLL